MPVKKSPAAKVVPQFPYDVFVTHRHDRRVTAQPAGVYLTPATGTVIVYDPLNTHTCILLPISDPFGGRGGGAIAAIPRDAIYVDGYKVKKNYELTLGVRHSVGGEPVRHDVVTFRFIPKLKSRKSKRSEKNHE